MFYTNAFVNLNLPATVLSLLSRTSHGYCICIYVRCASRHLTDDSQLCAAAGGDGPLLSIPSDLHRNFFWSLDKPLALVIGKFYPFPIFFGSFDWYQIGCVLGNLCEGMNARLDSALWSLETEAGWVSEGKCVLNITDIMMVTCLKMDVTSLNKLQSLLGLAFLWWVAMPRRV